MIHSCRRFAAWSFGFWAARILLIVVCGVATQWPSAAADEKAKFDEYLARLNRVNEGFATLRREQMRLVDRETELTRELEKSQAQIAQITLTAANIPGEVDSIRAQIDRLQSENDALIREATRSRRDTLRREAIRLTNEYRILEAGVTQERTRLNKLAADLKKASDALSKVRKQGLGQLDEFYKLADTFGRRSREEQSAAVVELSKFVNADNENLGAYLVRGIARRWLGEVMAAESDLTYVTNVAGPLQAVAHAARGELRIAAGKERDGRADFVQAAKLTSKQSDTRVILYREWLSFDEGKFSSAGTELKKALRLGGADADVHRLLALVHVALPDSPANAKAALENAERACEITKSEDWLCLETLAAAHAANEDFEAAVATMEKAALLATGENRERCSATLELYENRKPPDLTRMRMARLEGGKARTK